MRRLFLLAAVLAAASASPAHAQSLERYVATGGTLSLSNGVGYVEVAAHGGILGRIQRGRVSIRDNGAATEIRVWGANWTRVIDSRTTLYGGTRIRFRALGGAWRVRVRGWRIDASAAGRGVATVRGRAGTYSVNGEPPRPWRPRPTTVTFGG